MKRITYFLAILFLTVNSFAQGHFVVAFSGKGIDHMNITVITAAIGGINLEAGDEIAVFDGTICCGKAIISGPIDINSKITFAAIAASKEDDGLSNGYIVGNPIIYKFWDSSENREISGISAEYLDPEDGSTLTSPNFSINGSAFVKLSAPANQTPAADAGDDHSLNEGDEVILDGSGSSDSDSDPLTYLWTAPAGITLSSTTAEKPTFTAPEVIADTDFTFSLVVNDGTVDSPPDEVVITVKQINKAPGANAGVDQSVLKGTLVNLDGSGSSDPDSDPLTFTWTAPAGITLSSTVVDKPTFTAPDVITDTDFKFTLVVNDGTVDSPADEVIITVKPANEAPTANAGPDQTVNEGDLVTLDGSGSSDPDSDPLAYHWTAPDGITLNLDIPLNPTFTAPEVDADTDYTFSLVVNDGTTDSPADEVIITVKHVNKAPVANAGDNQSVNEGDLVTLDGSSGSSDPDSDPLTYQWTAPDGITLNLDIPSNPTFTAPEVDADTDYTFSLVVNDATIDSPAEEVVITVKHVNKAPVANAGDNQSVDEGDLVTLDGSGSSDPDSDPLTYQWTAPDGITLNLDIPSNPTFTAPNVDADTDYTFSLVVNDGTTDSPADEVIITVKAIVANQPPVANAGDNQSVDEGDLVTLDGSGSSDPESDPLTYQWTAPDGITLNLDIPSNPTFIAPNVDADADFIFSLVVNDGTVDSPADEVVITVKAVIANQPPIAVAGDDQAVDEGDLVTLDGSGSSDPESDPLTYQWTAPDGITLNLDIPSNPTFTAPDVDADADFTFSLVVNDGTTDSPADEVIITVKAIVANQPPVANAGDNQSVDEGDLVTLDGSGSSDPDSDPLTYQWTAPSGISLSSETDQKPTFTAPEVDTDTEFTFSLVVNDGTVDSPADEVKIMVKAIAVNQPPVACAGTDQKVDEGDLVMLDGSCSYDPDNRMALSWSLPGNTQLSSPLAIKVTVTGPAETTATDYIFSLMLLDGTPGSTTSSINWTVPAGVKFSSTTVSFIKITPPNSSNLNYSYTVKVFDGSDLSDPNHNGMTYFEIPPTDFIMNATTIIKMNITTPDATSLANQNFLIEVSDATNYPAQGIIYMTQSWKMPDEITLGNTTIAMLTINSPNVSNPDYHFTFEFNNGMGLIDTALTGLTYKWTAPPGIVLSSETDEKPTFTAPEVATDSQFTFSLVVNDGQADSAPDEVVITVLQANKVPTANAGSDQTVNEGATTSLDGSASSDPEVDALTYKWTAPPGIVLSSDSDEKPTFTAPEVSADTQFIFSLVVNDGKVDSAPDEVVITVLQVNKIPTADAGSDQSVNEGATATMDGSASFDPDGDVLTYKWTAPLGITLSSEIVVNPTFTVPEVDADTQYTFSLVVNDGQAVSPADEVVVTVLQADKAPYVKDPIKNVSVDKGAADQIIDLKTIFADDDPGDVLIYTVTSNTNDQIVSSTITGSNLTLDFSGVNVGSSEIVITASSNGKEVNSKFEVEVKIPTSTNPIIIEQKLVVYPNPSSGKIKVIFEQIPKSNTALTICNVNGTIVYKKTIKDKEESVDLTGNPAGIYLVKTNSDNLKVHKIILQ